MRRDEESDEWVLSAGRRLSANCGFLSVNDYGELASGYDELIACREGGEDFTAAERREIAEHQIALWRRWAGMEP